ncbi:uncharacterized protein Z520_07422 [Fonsecaea multimorphosa CBS 102226]|uniref:Transcription factor domain-containing protein n=1 Tax=Fonsecaea multimorphosa CBS 102226 TaxID=1442371 RepID=A0A0D2KJC2_9EURO|nr:uncharacterized protein Z520_07422 [Fonsecaea multimorphosa CBS 102226]KIX96703.1 hypothetical protein Z520_07422 [Fonsecaea multimorphosa CBS 102226]OAL22712.1 hypothetical protein AYO22_06940 [Fonsecaea multimorphosa]
MPSSRSQAEEAESSPYGIICHHSEVRLLMALAVRGRVEQLESSYTEILSLLRSQKNPSDTIGTIVPMSNSTPSYTDSQLSQNTGLVSPSGFHSCQSDTTVSNYLFDIALEECEKLINDYRRMSSNHFPYVLIPEACPVASLVEERPMLTQAILVSTTWRTPARQSALKDKFIKDLTDRYFLGSERSLDLLQALIVYFGWCQWHAYPVATQVYRLASLAVTLAVELGINQKPMNVTQHDMIMGSSAALSQSSETMSSKFWGYEARRAYLGAYTISTYGLFMFRKPCMLSYTQYLEDCAASLAADPQHPSDTMLIHMIHSLRVAEETTYTFDHGSKEKVGEFNDEKIQLLVRALSRQIEEWKNALPPGVFGIVRIQRAYYSVGAYMREVGLYGLLQGQVPSATRVSIIYDCFNCAMKYLSSVLESSLDEMADWTTLDWRALNFLILLSTKSSIILDSAYVSTEASQRAAWLGKCLDTLCQRAQELHRLKTDGCSYFQKISNEWANMKIYHQNCLQRSLSSSTGANSAQLSTQLPAQQHQTSSVPYLDNGFCVDPFNELFWAGFADSEQGLSNVFPM